MKDLRTLLFHMASKDIDIDTRVLFLSLGANPEPPTEVRSITVFYLDQKDTVDSSMFIKVGELWDYFHDDEKAPILKSMLGLIKGGFVKPDSVRRYVNFAILRAEKAKGVLQ